MGEQKDGRGSQLTAGERVELSRKIAELGYRAGDDRVSAILVTVSGAVLSDEDLNDVFDIMNHWRKNVAMPRLLESMAADKRTLELLKKKVIDTLLGLTRNPENN